METGRFRADLYHRLNNVTVSVPPLRERTEDLTTLIEDILARLQVQLGRKITGVSERFLTRLRGHSWPGNVRELQHVISQAALLEDGLLLEGKHFSPHAAGIAAQPAVTTVQPYRVDRHAMAKRALGESDGNKSRAAATLGITRKTLYAWLASPIGAGADKSEIGGKET